MLRCHICIRPIMTVLFFSITSQYNSNCTYTSHYEEVLVKTELVNMIVQTSCLYKSRKYTGIISQVKNITSTFRKKTFLAASKPLTYSTN